MRMEMLRKVDVQSKVEEEMLARVFIFSMVTFLGHIT